MTENNEQKFVDAIKTGFKQSVRDLDTNTLSKLMRLRRIALEGKLRKSFIRVFIPAGAAVAACLALLIYGLAVKSPVAPAVTADDIELISSSNSIDLYEELEFYQWLEDDVSST